MDKNKIIGVVGVVVVVLIAYFLAASNIPSVKRELIVDSVPTSTAPIGEVVLDGLPNKPSGSAVKNVTVNIKSAIFNPTPLIIKAGTVVTWVNNDAVPHMIVSNSGNLLNSGRLDPGEWFSFKFLVSGVYAYHCNIHPTMKGVVVVEN